LIEKHEFSNPQNEPIFSTNKPFYFIYFAQETSEMSVFALRMAHHDVIFFQTPR